MKSALQESVKPDGLGLGLSIILAIAENTDRIDFEQLEPQRPSDFITFPKQQK